jgi:hypothetical protein
VLSSKRKVKIFVEVDGEIEDGIITIDRKPESKKLDLFKSTENAALKYEKYPILIKDINFVKNSELEENLRKASRVAQITLGVLTVMSFPGSAHVGLMLIKVIQLFDFLSFINVKQPSNMVAFLEIFNENILNILPNPVAIQEYEDDSDVANENSQEKGRRILVSEVSPSVKCSTNTLMRENELSCYFLNSVGDIMIHFLAYCVLKGLLLFMVQIILKTMLNNLRSKIVDSSTIKQEKANSVKTRSMTSNSRDGSSSSKNGMKKAKSSSEVSVGENSKNSRMTQNELKKQSMLLKIANAVKNLDNMMNLKFFHSTFLAF